MVLLKKKTAECFQENIKTLRNLDCISTREAQNEENEVRKDSDDVNTESIESFPDKKQR